MKIEQRKSTNLTTKEALYVSFNYDLEKVEKIKSLAKRHYIPESKEWEVPIKDIDEVLTMFNDDEVILNGKVNPKVTTAVSKIIKFDEVDSSGFIYKTKPYQHQIEGFEYGLINNKFLLGDEQGLGKTKQAIDIAVARKSQFKHCLIVCGVNGLKWNWKDEIAIHSNEKSRILGLYMKKNGKIDIGSVTDRYKDLIADHDEFFLITNVETLRDDRVAKAIEQMTTSGIIGMTVIDEIHKCKNSTSQQGKAIHNCKSFYKMALTGTPLMNQPIDLYNVLKWLDAEHHTQYSFKNRYCIMGGFGNYQIVAYKNLSELQKLLDKNMLRRLKVDVLDLPPKIFTNEWVEMSGRQDKLYKEVLSSIKADIDQIKLDPNPLSRLIRLRQATGYPGILSSTISESAKLDRLEELAEELTMGTGKIIIFSNWTQITDIIEKKLRRFNPAIITGNTDEGDRPLEMRKFQTDENCKIILGTIGALGTGYTLTSADTVIFVDEPWSMAVKSQCMDRAHRIGQTKSVNVITLLTKDTIDERIHQIVIDKGEMADMLVDGKVNSKSKINLVDYLLS